MEQVCKICRNSSLNHQPGCFNAQPESQRLAIIWDFCASENLRVIELSYGSAGWCSTVTGKNGKGESWKHFDPVEAIQGAIKDFKEYEV